VGVPAETPPEKEKKGKAKKGKVSAKRRQEHVKVVD
jgi:hypothetical protein